MLDNQLILLFRPILIAGLISRGYTDVAVKQAYQPTQQGVNSGPTLYFFKISDHRYGFKNVSEVWDTIEQKMVHTETQNMETVFQIEGLVTQNPADSNTYTASDLLNVAAGILQSDATVKTLITAGVGIYKISDIRNPYFIDDRDRFEASPSFDFTLTHKHTYVTESPVIQSTEFGIYRV